jgi:hypothetical protein
MCITVCWRSKQHFAESISSRERDEREDWAYEVALLMRNRFMAYEVYDDWYGGTSVTRDQWRQLVTNSPGMLRFPSHHDDAIWYPTSAISGC